MQFYYSEFEELEAVPTMAVIDGPLEPSSSTASNAPHLPEDNSFVNFFSVCLFLPSSLLFLLIYCVCCARDLTERISFSCAVLFQFFYLPLLGICVQILTFV